MKKTIAILTLLTPVLLSTCAQKGRSDYVVTIKTKYGDMTAILYDETPKHKANFVKLAKEKYFDSLLFHRVMDGFMIQGGDPNSKKALQGQTLGNGGPGYEVDAEFNPKFFHEKGALSAARLGDQMNPQKKSSGSQFYIVQGVVIKPEELKIDQRNLQAGLQRMFQDPQNKPLFDSLTLLYQTGDMTAYQARLNSLASRIEKQTGIQVTRDVSPEKIKAYGTIGGTPFLDGEYTVFGKVIKGLDVIDKIASQPRDAAERPLEDIRMTVTVEEMSKKKITNEYGYEFPSQE